MNHSSEVLSFHTMPIYTSIYRMTSFPLPILGWLTHCAEGRCLLFRQWPIKLGSLDVTTTSVIHFTQLYTSINQLPKTKLVTLASSLVNGQKQTLLEGYFSQYFTDTHFRMSCITIWCCLFLNS